MSYGRSYKGRGGGDDRSDATSLCDDDKRQWSDIRRNGWSVGSKMAPLFRGGEEQERLVGT